MTIKTEIFVATAQQAFDHARDRDAGGGPATDLDSVEAAGVTDMDLEILGSIAATAVHVPGGEYVLELADVELDTLQEVPGPMVQVLADLLDYRTDDGESVLPAVAQRWAKDSDMALYTEETEPLVTRLAELASAVGDADERHHLYVWTNA